MMAPGIPLDDAPRGAFSRIGGFVRGGIYAIGAFAVVAMETTTGSAQCVYGGKVSARKNPQQAITDGALVYADLTNAWASNDPTAGPAIGFAQGSAATGADVLAVLIVPQLFNSWNNTILRDEGVVIAQATKSKHLRLSSGYEDWIDYNYDPAALFPNSAGFPDTGNLASTTIKVALFDAANIESVSVVFELNHNYAEGTALSPHVHWYPTNTNTGSVVWGIEYAIVKPGGTAATGTTITKTQAANGTAWMQHLAAFSDIAGTGLEIGDQVHMRFHRVANNAADTYNADAAVATIGVHARVNSFGSDALEAKA